MSVPKRCRPSVRREEPPRRDRLRAFLGAVLAVFALACLMAMIVAIWITLAANSLVTDVDYLG